MAMRTASIRWSLQRTNMILTGLAIALSVMVSAAGAQEQSLKPGVNKKYENPDIEKTTKFLESENREIYKHRNEILALLDLKPGMDVADVGAGTGFFSRMMAKKVGPDGVVHAVEIQPNFVENLKRIAAEESRPNLKPVQCNEKSTMLAAECVDLVFICDTYHHIEYPYHTLASIYQALRPDGRLFIIDFERVKGLVSESRYEHVRCGKGTVTDEVKDAGFDFIEEVPMMKGQWIRTFRKRPGN